MRLATLLFAVLLSARAVAAPPIIQYEIVDQQSHPENFFTQGLLVDGPWLYESSGRYGASMLARYKANDTSFLTTQRLSKSIFAEGLTLLNDQFYLLTWRAQRLLVFDRNWTQVAEHRYQGQGWGLTDDGKQLISSDGSDQLRFYNPEGYQLERTLRVTGFGRKWDRLNELEYVDGIIWANRWMTDEVIAIDAATGKVRGLLDLRGLSKQWRSSKEQVLNGLAWSSAHQALWVTGKYWPVRYLVKINFPQELVDEPR